MKKIIAKQMFANAKELIEATEEMLSEARKARKKRDGSKLWDSEVSCTFGDAEKVVLIEEKLSDGSYVYNLELR